jgi:hypothetical protein
VRAVARELGSACHGIVVIALEEGVGVVQEARVARVLHRRETAARHVPALDRDRPQPGLAETGLQDQGVVAGAENDPVVVRHGYSRPSRR